MSSDYSEIITHEVGGVRIQTFIFVDIETTSLYRPDICEICFIAVSRTSLLNTKCSSPHPRVLNKLLLCINPQKPMEFQASQITGLYNDELERCRPWGCEMADLIRTFLMKLSSPLCLLAHNGLKFDFPLLYKHMENVGVKLESDVYCADTIHILKAIDDKAQKSLTQQKVLPESATTPKTLISHVFPPEAPRKDSKKVYGKIGYTCTADLYYSSSTPTEYLVTNESNGNNYSKKRGVKRNLLLEFNEQPLKESTNKLIDDVTGLNGNNSNNDVLKSHFMACDELSNESLFSSEQETTLDSDETTLDSDNFSSSWDESEFMHAVNVTEEEGAIVYSKQSECKTRVRSYKLDEVYRRYFGEYPRNSHSAEDDCLSLLKIAHARSSDFCYFVDEQCTTFHLISI